MLLPKVDESGAVMVQGMVKLVNRHRGSGGNARTSRLGKEIMCLEISSEEPFSICVCL